jgi:hypothetical protein
LPRIYAILKDKNNVLNYLDKTLKNKEESVNYVLKDEAWKEYLKDFKKLTAKYQNWLFWHLQLPLFNNF